MEGVLAPTQAPTCGALARVRSGKSHLLSYRENIPDAAAAKTRWNLRHKDSIGLYSVTYGYIGLYKANGKKKQKLLLEAFKTRVAGQGESYDSGEPLAGQ